MEVSNFLLLLLTIIAPPEWNTSDSLTENLSDPDNGNRCPGDDFQCKNGRCIYESWRCDKRNDCGDNSDEENCPETGVCSGEVFPCDTRGECIAPLWRCDGEPDCTDGSDEAYCNNTQCDPERQLRCDHGQCIPISWVCDETKDCHDGSDERNCSKKKTCSQHEFRCEIDGTCVDEKMRCDKTVDCSDASDETNCSFSNHHGKCMKDMYKCADGSCIYNKEVCDGHNDCNNGEDEFNCSHKYCHPDETYCQPTKMCIPVFWICDGHPDCPDKSDEKDCNKTPKQPPRLRPKVKASECDEFFCQETGQCIPWSKVCDGIRDCENKRDEGGLCHRACSGDNGGCSQICKKSPQGPQCSCLKGYRLQADKKTCEDINECLEPGTCSHFCNNTKGGFKCSCAEGYFLHTHDHRLCKADGGPATLVYALGSEIRSFELVSRTQRVYLNMPHVDIRGVDYDASDTIFFWTEWNSGSINSYSPDTERQNIIVHTSSKPIYIKYDWIAKNLYYSESSRIGVCRKDGQFCRILIEKNASIDSLDISPTTGYMFWTTWMQIHQKSGLIERVEMDGSNKLSIVSENTMKPTSVTVDHILQVIYWVDPELKSLECAQFDGSKRRQIVRYDMYYPYAMTVFEDHVYWADWRDDIIVKCEKFTGKECSPIKNKDVKAQVLLIIHKVMQPKGINRCINSNCHHMCLLTHYSYFCACTDGFHQKNGVCEPIPLTPPSPCPKHYCTKGGECVVENGENVCK